MMLTEEEAKKKWCPYSRDQDGQPLGRCVGSACMAWREVTRNELTETVFAGTREGKSGTGYCGLAGKP